MHTSSINGETYFGTFTDDNSGRVRIGLLQTKDGALLAFESYRVKAEGVSGNQIKSMGSDGGGEYLNMEFEKYLAESGFQHRIRPPYGPAQNRLTDPMK